MPQAGPFITMSEAAQLLPHPPSMATMRRWSTRGIKGLRLKTFKVGRQRLTTAQEMIRFITGQREDDRLGESREDDDDTEIDDESEIIEFQTQNVIRSTTPDGRTIEDFPGSWDEEEEDDDDDDDDVDIRVVHL